MATEVADVDLGLAGKVALVTASSRGLGRASAQALSQEGAKVVLCARDEAALAEAAAAMPGEALAVAADVTDPATPQRLADAAVDRFGGLDVLVANAGGPPPARALEVDDETLQAALQANLLTSIRLVQASLPPMRAAGWGVIVKEAVANGRLTPHGQGPAAAVLGRVAASHGVGVDAVALAAVLANPWADVVLSGAVTPAQLEANLAAVEVELDPGELEELAALAEPPEGYWKTRAALSWS